jgi:phage gpG-like protein
MREFHSLGEAARHLVALNIDRQTGAMDEAAKLVQVEAKSLIGTYPGDEPPFAAWPELADSTKEDRVHQGYTENDPLLRSGDMRESIERIATTDMAVVGSAEDKALYQELGTAKIPPRSFLGMAAMRKGEEVADIIGEGVVAAIVGGPGGGAFTRKLTRL